MLGGGVRGGLCYAVIGLGFVAVAGRYSDAANAWTTLLLRTPSALVAEEEDASATTLAIIGDPWGGGNAVDLRTAGVLSRY